MTPEELEHIAQTEQEAQAQFSQTVKVCVAAGCLSCQSQSVKDALDKEVARRGWGDHCQTKGVGCMGLCSEGPLVSTQFSTSQTLYKRIAPEDSASLLDSLES